MSKERYGTESQTIQITTGDPNTVNDSTQQAPLGAVILWKGEKYRYVKFDNGTGNVASAAGGVAHWKTLTPASDPPVFTVTSDQDDALASLNSVAGIFGAVITDAFFCWLKITGRVTAKVAASTTKGDHLTGGSTDLTFARIAESAAITDTIYATALDSVTGGTATVFLKNLDW